MEKSMTIALYWMSTALIVWLKNISYNGCVDAMPISWKYYDRLLPVQPILMGDAMLIGIIGMYAND